MQRSLHGFTLVELLVTIAIVGILAAIGLPSMRELIASSRISSEANDILTAISFGRSEAIKRNAITSMCPSSDGANCASSTSWSSGWIVRVGRAESAGTVLRVYPAINSQDTLTSTNNVNITFLANGQAEAAKTFNLCSSSSNSSRNLQMALSGRVSTTSPGTCS